MSRFSKAEAETRGWRFVHEREEYTTVLSGTQGRSETTPATIRAEKYVSIPGRGVDLINEEAASMGLLLERIASWEAHQENTAIESGPAPVTEPVPLDDQGAPQATVVLPGGVKVTEEEFAARERQDALLTHEGMVFYEGAQIGSDDDDLEEVESEVEATDAARERAHERGIDLSTIEGTGKDGRIVLDDIPEE